jgi:hypothetical protein
MAGEHVLREGKNFYTWISVRRNKEVRRHSAEDFGKVVVVMHGYGVKLEDCSFELPSGEVKLNPFYTLGLDALPDEMKEKFAGSLRQLETY